MANRSFNIPRSKDPFRVSKILGAIDIAAKYFVYKLYDATRRVSIQKKVARCSSLICGRARRR